MLFLIAFFAALTPGVDLFYVVRNGICNGLKGGLSAAFGILSGNAVYVFLSVVGVGGVIGKYKVFMIGVLIFGGIYLLKIAKELFYEKVEFRESCENDGLFEIYKRGLLLNLSNPKAMIFFSVIITPYLDKNALFSAFSLYGGVFCAFVLAAVVSGSLGVRKEYFEVINKISAFLFFVFGIRLLIEGVLLVR